MVSPASDIFYPSLCGDQGTPSFHGAVLASRRRRVFVRLIKLVAAGLACCAMTYVASAGTTSTKPAPDFKTELPAMVRKADSAKIRYFRPEGEGVAEVFDPRWFSELAAVLDGASFKPSAVCFCISYPIIDLYAGNEKFASVSVHHSEKLLFIGEGGFGGDFVVGKEVGSEISKLAESKKVLVPPPKPVLPPIEIPKPKFTPTEADKPLL